MSSYFLFNLSDPGFLLPFLWARYIMGCTGIALLSCYSTHGLLWTPLPGSGLEEPHSGKYHDLKIINPVEFWHEVKREVQFPWDFMKCEECSAIPVDFGHACMHKLYGNCTPCPLDFISKLYGNCTECFMPV